jgi:hypothetical protein
LLLGTSLAQAADPVKQIRIYVTPYYASAKEPGEAPQVNVGKTYSTLLASTKRDDILAARDQVQARPERVTPMTLMVLAVRLYDMGLRDDAVFWYYVAVDRYATMEDVLDVAAPRLAEAAQAVRAFAALVGPHINGYAFCDIAKQQRIRKQAFAWVEKHTYEALFAEDLPAKTGDRRENLKRALERAAERMKKEQEYLDSPDNLAQIRKTRQENNMAEKYCWEDE